MNNKIKQFLSDWELQNYEVKQILGRAWRGVYHCGLAISWLLVSPE